ncbi:MAG: hypothetical protein QX191_00460 [Methylococcaceae bacterium]
MNLSLANISSQQRDLILFGAAQGIIASLSACLLIIAALDLFIMVWELIL